MIATDADREGEIIARECLNAAKIYDYSNIKRFWVSEATTLYLNDLQKDAFRKFNYSAEETLQIVQKLYEEYKCVSYPRTPSKVMGEDNIELCNLTSSMLKSKYPCYTAIFFEGDYSSNNIKVYDNSKLESHHALIPLAVLPETANTIEKNIYDLILRRFFLAFCPVHIYEKQIVLLDVNGYRFEIIGKKVIEEDWKKFIKKDDETKEPSNAENQDLSNIDWDTFFS